MQQRHSGQRFGVLERQEGLSSSLKGRTQLDAVKTEIDDWITCQSSPYSADGLEPAGMLSKRILR